MNHIKMLTAIISCMLLFFLIANTTATASTVSTAVDAASNNGARIGMASSSSNRVRLSCNNGGCIGMAASSGVL